MFLYRIVMNQRSKEARRDVSDAYQMHSTLCRAFSTPDEKCREGAFLWRLESECSYNLDPVLLIVSREQASWHRIGLDDWMKVPPDGPIDLHEKFNGPFYNYGMVLRFRLKANASSCKDGKRHAIRNHDGQIEWLNRQANKNGFEVLNSVVTNQDSIKVTKRLGNEITLFSVQYDGFLRILDRAAFINAMQNGIGHGRALGLGLLTAVPQ